LGATLAGAGFAAAGLAAAFDAGLGGLADWALRDARLASVLALISAAVWVVMASPLWGFSIGLIAQFYLLQKVIVPVQSHLLISFS